MTITIYTDGACKGNGQLSQTPGGWGAVIDNGRGNHLLLAGHTPDTTNQRMELTAAIEALKALKRSLTVHLYTDSQYLKNGLTEWLPNWKAKGWVNAQRKPVANADLWKELDSLMQIHNVIVHWVKSHSGDPGNELADQLANFGASGKTLKQYR